MQDSESLTYDASSIFFFNEYLGQVEQLWQVKLKSPDSQQV